MRFLRAVLALLPLIGLSGCGDEPRPQLRVLAASSLTESFAALSAEFAKTHPDVQVSLVFDSSRSLSNMATQGAPGDVLATADEKSMTDATAGNGTQGTPRKFATNQMVVVVPRHNPGNVQQFKDLQRTEFITCVLNAPCGSLANQLMANNRVTATAVSEEVDVKAVLARVVSGEADAGIVYVTDAMAAGDRVKTIPIPGSADLPTTYWIARTASGSSAAAQDWVDFVVGPVGQRVLASYGFASP